SGEPGAPDEPLEYASGPALQIQHLAELGHRKAVYAESSDPRVADLVAERAGRASRAAAELGVILERRAVVDPEPATVAEWHAAGVTAVAGYNDDVAARVLNAALRARLAVPRDLA